MNAPDYPPMSPGELLREEFLTPLDITADDLARRAELAPELVRDVLAGRIAVTPVISTALGQAFGMSPQFWMNVQAAYDAEVQADLV